MNGRILRELQPSGLPFPRVGFIKIGAKNERGLPVSLDYFIPSGKYGGLFTNAYGEKPNTIQIIFPDDDPVKVCREEYTFRDDKGNRIAFGDGVNFSVWDGNKYQNLSVVEYPGLMDKIATKYKSNKGWEVGLQLNFICPLVRGVIGYWQFNTKGNASTIPTIVNTFDEVKKQLGTVKGLVFDLNVQFHKSNSPGASRYPVVTLVLNQSDENVAKISGVFKDIKRLE